jgi:hypothetical protein
MRWMEATWRVDWKLEEKENTLHSILHAVRCRIRIVVTSRLSENLASMFFYREDAKIAKKTF